MIPLLFAALIATDGPRLVESRRIWDEAPHNAFTGLVRDRVGDRWICAFREGASHVSPDGAIRLIASIDGVEWQSLARLTMDGADLRDPKIVADRDGRILLTAAAAYPADRPGGPRHQTFVWTSAGGDGRRWDGPRAVGDPDIWLWRLAYTPNGGLLGVGYGTADRPFVRLYAGEKPDGSDLAPSVATLSDDGQPNEAGIAFRPDGAALVLLRRDGDGPAATGLLGRSSPPYTDWSWVDLGARIGGPDLLRLPDGRFVAGVRLYDGGARTALAWLDPDAGRLTEFLALPSGGDTSYPGLAWHDGRLWLSYYSSHEGKTSLYFAEVELPPAGR